MNTSHVDAGNDGKSEYGVDYGSFKWKARLEDLEQKKECGCRYNKIYAKHWCTIAIVAQGEGEAEYNNMHNGIAVP